MQYPSAKYHGIPYHTTDKGFFCTGEKEIFTLETEEGYKIKLTNNHKLFKAEKKDRDGCLLDWAEVRDLKSGDKLMLNNHRSITRWKGYGNFKEGWLVGSFLITGYSLRDYTKDSEEVIIFMSDQHKTMCEIAQKYIEGLEAKKGSFKINCFYNFSEISCDKLSELVKKYFEKIEVTKINDVIEKASFDFYTGFLVGIFDAFGEVNLFGKNKDKVRVCLINNNINWTLDKNKKY